MKLVETPLKDLFVIEPSFFPDNRGYFLVGYSAEEFAKVGLKFNFMQDNQSKSTYGVIRGMHYQIGENVQTKLVRAVQGSIFDVALDCRRSSPTFGKWFGIELSDDNQKQLLVPKGFAHGFSVLSETATVLYKIDTPYAPSTERGFRFDDPALGINWGIEPSKVIQSPKDAIMPMFKDAEIPF